MKLLCISASNVKNNREKSASTKACSIIRDIVKLRMGNKAVVDIHCWSLFQQQWKLCRWMWLD